jgi:hypothetical protein
MKRLALLLCPVLAVALVGCQAEQALCLPDGEPSILISAIAERGQAVGSASDEPPEMSTASLVFQKTVVGLAWTGAAVGYLALVGVYAMARGGSNFVH